MNDAPVKALDPEDRLVLLDREIEKTLALIDGARVCLHGGHKLLEELKYERAREKKEKRRVKA